MKIKQELIDSPPSSPVNFQWNLDDVKNLPQQDFNPFDQSTQMLKKRRGRPKKNSSAHEPMAESIEPKEITITDSSSSSENADDSSSSDQMNEASDCPQLTIELGDWEPRHSNRLRTKSLKRKKQEMPALKSMKKVKQDGPDNFDQVPSSDTDSDNLDSLDKPNGSSYFKSIPKEDIIHLMSCRVVLSPLAKQVLESLSKGKASFENDSSELVSGHGMTEKLSILSKLNKGMHKLVKEYHRKDLGTVEPFDTTILNSLNQEPEVNLSL